MAVQRPRGPIVSDVMSRNVLTVHQDRRVGDAVEMMAKNDIGSVVVLDDIGPRGLFTERNLLEKVIVAGKDPWTTEIREVLSPGLPVGECEMTAEEAAVTMV